MSNSIIHKRSHGLRRNPTAPNHTANSPIKTTEIELPKGLSSAYVAHESKNTEEYFHLSVKLPIQPNGRISNGTGSVFQQQHQMKKRSILYTKHTATNKELFIDPEVEKVTKDDRIGEEDLSKNVPRLASLLLRDKQHKMKLSLSQPVRTNTQQHQQAFDSEATDYYRQYKPSSSNATPSHSGVKIVNMLFCDSPQPTPKPDDLRFDDSMRSPPNSMPSRPSTEKSSRHTTGNNKRLRFSFSGYQQQDEHGRPSTDPGPILEGSTVLAGDSLANTLDYDTLVNTTLGATQNDDNSPTVEAVLRSHSSIGEILDHQHRGVIQRHHEELASQHPQQQLLLQQQARSRTNSASHEHQYQLHHLEPQDAPLEGAVSGSHQNLQGRPPPTLDKLELGSGKSVNFHPELEQRSNYNDNHNIIKTRTNHNSSYHFNISHSKSANNNNNNNMPLDLRARKHLDLELVYNDSGSGDAVQQLDRSSTRGVPVDALADLDLTHTVIAEVDENDAENDVANTAAAEKEAKRAQLLKEVELERRGKHAWGGMAMQTVIDLQFERNDPVGKSHPFDPIAITTITTTAKTKHAANQRTRPASSNGTHLRDDGAGRHDHRPSSNSGASRRRRTFNDSINNNNNKVLSVTSYRHALADYQRQKEKQLTPEERTLLAQYEEELRSSELMDALNTTVPTIATKPCTADTAAARVRATPVAWTTAGTSKPRARPFSSPSTRSRSASPVTCNSKNELDRPNAFDHDGPALDPMMSLQERQELVEARNAVKLMKYRRQLEHERQHRDQVEVSVVAQQRDVKPTELLAPQVAWIRRESRARPASAAAITQNPATSAGTKQVAATSVGAAVMPASMTTSVNGQIQKYRELLDWQQSFRTTGMIHELETRRRELQQQHQRDGDDIDIEVAGLSANAVAEQQLNWKAFIDERKRADQHKQLQQEPLTPRKKESVLDRYRMAYSKPSMTAFAAIPATAAPSATVGAAKVEQRAEEGHEISSDLWGERQDPLLFYTDQQHERHPHCDDNTDFASIATVDTAQLRVESAEDAPTTTAATRRTSEAVVESKVDFADPLLLAPDDNPTNSAPLQTKTAATRKPVTDPTTSAAATTTVTDNARTDISDCIELIVAIPNPAPPVLSDRTNATPALVKQDSTDGAARKNVIIMLSSPKHEHERDREGSEEHKRHQEASSIKNTSNCNTKPPNNHSNHSHSRVNSVNSSTNNSRMSSPRLQEQQPTRQPVANVSITKRASLDASSPRNQPQLASPARRRASQNQASLAMHNILYQQQLDEPAIGLVSSEGAQSVHYHGNNTATTLAGTGQHAAVRLVSGVASSRIGTKVNHQLGDLDYNRVVTQNNSTTPVPHYLQQQQQIHDAMLPVVKIPNTGYYPAGNHRARSADSPGSRASRQSSSTAAEHSNNSINYNLYTKTNNHYRDYADYQQLSMNRSESERLLQQLEGRAVDGVVVVESNGRYMAQPDKNNTSARPRSAIKGHTGVAGGGGEGREHAHMQNGTMDMQLSLSSNQVHFAPRPLSSRDGTRRPAHGNEGSSYSNNNNRNVQVGVTHGKSSRTVHTTHSLGRETGKR